MYVGVALMVMAGAIIFGGLRTIARTAEILVPAMALCYLLLALFIMFANIGKLPDILVLIFRSAFGLEEAASGALGYTIAQGMINGLKRGLFLQRSRYGVGSQCCGIGDALPAAPGFPGVCADARGVHGHYRDLLGHGGDYSDVGGICPARRDHRY